MRPPADEEAALRRALAIYGNSGNPRIVQDRLVLLEHLARLYRGQGKRKEAEDAEAQATLLRGNK
jgi:hypothetical protein